MGSNAAANGARTSSTPARKASPVAPAGSGRLMVVPAPVAGADLAQAAGARVQRELVVAGVGHPAVGPEHVLGAVAVVGVVVDDQHPLARARRARPR